MSDSDSPWKEILDRFFELFLAFYFPQIHSAIDWSRGYESLDKELQQLEPSAEIRRRYVDKLVKVWTRDGLPQWLVIHLEIQSYEAADFPERMFVYNYRLFDRFGQPAVSLAVLADDRPGWRPNAYSFDLWGCRGGLEFPVVKLFDYAGREDDLLADANPFAVVTLAHLKTRETRTDQASRQLWKIRLVRHLYERGYAPEWVRGLFRFLDWMLELPEELDKQFWLTIKQIEEERGMPYVSIAERVGREEGFKEGLKEGQDRGLKEGLKEGQVQGQKEGLLLALELAFNEKFGEEGAREFDLFRKHPELATLRLALQAILQGRSLEEVRRLRG